MTRPAIAVAVAGTLGFVSACHRDQARLNAPPQGAANRNPSIHAYYAHMNDQALMQDRCIADMHFIPHTAELNGTGRARLQRYAELLATRGGKLSYDTRLADEDLIAARIASAKQCLAQAVPGSAPIEIEVGLPGGLGMEGEEAINRRKAMVSQTPDSGSTSSGGLFGDGGS